MQSPETKEEEEDHSADGSILSASIATHADSNEGTTSESSEQQNNSSLPSEQQRMFELNEKATAFYGNNSNIKAYYSEVALFPKSRSAAENVTESRPFSVCDKMIRGGRNPFAVETPVQINEDLVVLSIASNYKLNPHPIIFDKRDGTVSWPEKSVISVTRGMSGNTKFDSDLLETMDTACAAFLQEMVLGPMNESKEG